MTVGMNRCAPYLEEIQLDGGVSALCVRRYVYVVQHACVYMFNA